jgi:hypothetical protein
MPPHASDADYPVKRRGILGRHDRRARVDRRGAKPRWRPVCEGLEARDLPSVLLPRAARVDSRFVPNPAVIQQSINLLYGPGSATPMTPTPREVKRQTFAARWIGNYTIGPPTFSDRASTIHAWSENGGANQFLKGKFQLELFPPANPNAAPNPGNPFANRVSGLAVLVPWSTLQNSATLLLDLSAPASDPGFTSSGLPTHLSWTYDPGSGGSYIGPVGFTQGTGTLDIKWHPDARPLPHTLGSGKLIVTFQGVINYNQIASPTSPVYS